MTLTHSRMLKALACQPVDRPPLWVMRQAGRYLPEYRKIRANVPDFMTFCRTPDLATEATLQPLRRFELDAAIIFSDILTVPDAMGTPVRFAAGEGPVFDTPAQSKKIIDSLIQPDVEEQLSYVAEAIKQTRAAMPADIPLLGFAGSPWTIACYQVEGGSSKLFFTIKRMAYTEPELLHQLLQKITLTTIDYLRMQINAGANAIMLFDSWGGVLSPHMYDAFSLHYLHTITQAIKETHPDTPVIAFSKQAHHAYTKLASIGLQGIGVDWMVDLAHVREQVGPHIALQGNLDPSVMLSTPERVKEEAHRMLDQIGSQPGYIANLGHGIDKNTPIDNMHALIEAVHTHTY